MQMALPWRHKVDDHSEKLAEVESVLERLEERAERVRDAVAARRRHNHWTEAIQAVMQRRGQP